MLPININSLVYSVHNNMNFNPLISAIPSINLIHVGMLNSIINKLTKSYKPYELQELITTIVKEVVNSNGYNHKKIKKIIKKHKKSDSSDSSDDDKKEDLKIIVPETHVKSYSNPPQLLEDDVESEITLPQHLLEINKLLRLTQEQFANKHYDVWIVNIDKIIIKLNTIIDYIKTIYPERNVSVMLLSSYTNILTVNINQLKSKKHIIDNLHIETEESISELRLVQKSIETFVELFLNVLKGIDTKRKYLKQKGGSDSFKSKALKYKEKYLQLKNQLNK
jgi:hypothetical protein